MLGSSLHAPPSPPPAPEQLLKGYRWPASRITKADMMKLTELREQTGEPITLLIHEAIGSYYHLLRNGEGDSEERANGGAASEKSPTHEA